MWQEPKTNWVSTDYFNYTDYNRIKGNIEYLESLTKELFLDFDFESMGSDKTSYTDYPYADEFTAVENNLQLMRNRTFLFDNSGSKTWYENAPTPNYEDLNRIENACLAFKKGFENIKANKKKLSIRLGNTSFIKI